ncbi:unnamed protein product [Moneuplotes crassus]|uniref:Uncharacterized protein n=1 Tax=Euplotes crassus TaxID=5936 RepID=A0AAD1UI48_EUPCR|nr:unnamed protein product [Moneuplotes crassus]
MNQTIPQKMSLNPQNPSSPLLAPTQRSTKLFPLLSILQSGCFPGLKILILLPTSKIPIKNLQNSFSPVEASSYGLSPYWGSPLTAVTKSCDVGGRGELEIPGFWIREIEAEEGGRESGWKNWARELVLRLDPQYYQNLYHNLTHGKKLRGRPRDIKQTSPEIMWNKIITNFKDRVAKRKKTQKKVSRIDARNTTACRDFKRIVESILKYVGSKCRYKSKNEKDYIDSYTEAFTVGFLPVIDSYTDFSLYSMNPFLKIECPLDERSGSFKFTKINTTHRDSNNTNHIDKIATSQLISTNITYGDAYIANKVKTFCEFIVLSYPEAKVKCILDKCRNECMLTEQEHASLVSQLKARKKSSIGNFRNLAKENSCFKSILWRFWQMIPQMGLDDEMWYRSVLEKVLDTKQMMPLFTIEKSRTQSHSGSVTSVC